MPSFPVSRSPSSWVSRNQTDPPTAFDAHTPQPLPSSHPKPPTFKNSALKGFQSVFHRKPPPHSLSVTSLHSFDSLENSTPDSPNRHLYAAMPPPPRPVVSNHDTLDDEQECPVCLEPLSFSFRLPGEKPHVVPECGHSLHEVSTQIFSNPTLIYPPSIGLFHCCLRSSPWPVQICRSSQIQLGRVRCVPPSHESWRWRR